MTGVGVARRLVEESLAWARGREAAEVVTLVVSAENTAAQQLYEKMGWRPVLTRPIPCIDMLQASGYLKPFPEGTAPEHTVMIRNLP